MKNNSIAVLVIVAVVALVLGPFITMWSLNTLFGMSIDYSFVTWLAMVWLQLVTFGGVASAVRNT